METANRQSRRKAYDRFGGLVQLRQKLKELTEINRKNSNKRKRNEYDDLERFDKAYFDALNISDRKLYGLFDALTAEKK